MRRQTQRVRTEYRLIGTSGVTETFDPPPEVVKAKLMSARVVSSAVAWPGDDGSGPSYVELIWFEVVR